jgi:hypothetical protein
VKIVRSVSIGLFAVLVLFGGLAGSANAARVKQVSARHYRPKKEKQHPVKDHYRSPITGNTLYGKPVKPKH